MTHDPPSSAAAVPAASGKRRGPERFVTINVKETRAVAVVGLVVLGTLLAPPWCFERSVVLKLLVVPVVAVMLLVRGAQSHRKTVLKQKT
jgi:hypothetical protein